MKVVNQDIPSELLDAYKRSLRQSTDWKPGADIHTIRTRQPFRIPHMQSDSPSSPSPAQLKVREAFRKCVECYKGSPKTGGAVPPEVGFRSREWWYNAAQGSGMWYFNYMMSLSWWFFYDDCIPDWCGLCIPIDHVKDPYYKEGATDWIDGWDAAWDATWDLYQVAGWVDYPYQMDIMIAEGVGYGYGWYDFRGVISCDKATLVFKPCEHVSEYTWLNVENIKVQFKTKDYTNGMSTARIRCIETGEVQTQEGGQTIFYIPSDYWHYDEMTLTFETFCEIKDGLKPNIPMPYNVSSTSYYNYIDSAGLYCVGKGIY